MITFGKIARATLQDFQSYIKYDQETEKKIIIETAAKLTSYHIYAEETLHDVYPDCKPLKTLKMMPSNCFQKVSGFY